MSFGRLFVGNISYSLDENALTGELAALGIEAKNVRIIRDRETGQGKGFGFFDVDSSKVEETINIANNALVAGRPLRVNMATKQPDDKRPPPSRPRPQPTRDGHRREGAWEDDTGSGGRRRR